MAGKVRTIGGERHNQFVAKGVEEHQPTRLAPSTLYQPLEEEVIESLRHTYSGVYERVSRTLGQPRYANDGFILYEGDLCDYLRLVKKSGLEIDLKLTSPPYNIGKEYEEIRPVEEYVDWCSSWMYQLYDVTGSKGAFWLNVGYLEVGNQGLRVPIPYLLWDRSPFYLIQEIVWKYGAGDTTKRRLCPRNEKWLFYVKDPSDFTFNLDEIRDPNVKYPNQKKNGKFRRNPLGKNPSDVWEFPKVTTGARRSSKERTGHPAQFPLAVVERIVKACSNASELILDPFAGSCSAGIAAVALGRVFLGFEINPNYCDLAIKRFEGFLAEREIYQSQKTLF